MAEAKKCLEPQRYYSTLKTSTAVTDLSPNIFLNTFSTVSHMYCLSFLKFHCLMSLHDGRSQKVSWAAKVLVYFKDIYCSDWPVSYHLSQHFLNCLTSVLSLLSQISLSHVSTWWQKPKSVLSRKGITLLWRHLLQCHTCHIPSFSTLSQLSHIWTVSPFSNFTVSCLYMMAEPKNCLEPQRYYCDNIYYSLIHLSHSFLNPFSLLSHSFLNSLISLHAKNWVIYSPYAD